MTNMPDRTDILDLEDRRFRATTSLDLLALDALIADDLHYVHSNGGVENKTEFLRKLASGERVYRTYQALGRKTRQEGGFSFVFGQVEVVLARAAGDVAMRLAYTAVYRDHPTPRLMAWHSVRCGGA